MELGPNQRKKLAISFSGGRSSAVMTKLLWDRRDEWDQVSITFANTGEEHPATLEFVHACEVRFGWPVVWLEAVIHPDEGKAISHKVVDFETATRPGKVGLDHPFEAVIAKYGIFNHTAKSCTTKLKELPMESYRKTLGYQFGANLDHDTAIGIRADEVDRMSASAREKRHIYPLIRAGITKREVSLEIKRWGIQDPSDIPRIDLQIPSDAYGNCRWCFKKSLRKLMTVAKESPESFDFPRRMDEQYGTHKAGPEYKSAVNGRRYFFRGHMSTDELIAKANTEKFEPYRDDPWEHGRGQRTLFDERLDVGSGCGNGESCEIGMDDE